MSTFPKYLYSSSKRRGYFIKLIAVLYCLLLFACKDNRFALKGNAIGIDNAIVGIVSDSYKQNTNVSQQKFEIKGLVEKPDFCTLYINFNGKPEKKREYLFYLEPGQYELNLQSDKLDEYPDIESSSTVQQEISRFYKNKLTEYDYIIANPKSLLSAYFLSNMEEEIESEPQKYYNAYEALHEEIKSSKYGKWAGKQINSVVKNQEGQPLPVIHGVTLEGKPFNPDVLKGKLTAIMFWTTYNKDSQADIPQIKSLYEKFHQKGFEVLSISYDKSEERWKHSIEAYKMNWLHVNEFKGNLSENISSFNNSRIPYYVIISPDLKIIDHGVPLESIVVYINDYLKSK